MTLLGIDIGGTAVKLGVVDPDSGALLHREEHPVDFDNYRTPILTTVVGKTRELLARLGERPAGIGISATGQIDAARGYIAGTCGNLPGWVDVPLGQTFKDRFDLPTTAMNDANCALLGEYWLGGAQGTQDALMVTLGTGVGGGVLIGGNILNGSRGFGGELGHMVYRADGRLCTCGNRGCWEQYASVKALLLEARLLLGDHALDGKALFERVQAGDIQAADILQEWMQTVATGLVGLVHLFNPTLVLLGGGVSEQDALFIAPLRARVMDSVMPRYRDNLRLEAARLGNTAGIMGAVYHWLTVHRDMRP